MPENQNPFKQFKEDVLAAGWEGQDYDFAALEGKLPAEKIKELQRTWKLEKLKRAAYEAGRLGEEVGQNSWGPALHALLPGQREAIDCISLEQEWDAKITSLERMHERGKSRPPGPGEKRPRGHGEDRDNFDQTRYELGEKIGSGAFGTVYKARDLEGKWGDGVAIKIQRSLWKKMTYDEARQIRNVRSRYVVQVEDFGELKKPDGDPRLLSRFQDELELIGCPQLNTEDRDRRIYLVMEWMDGESLDKYISPGWPAVEREAINWMLECCKGMSEVHAEDIIHRDLKPENIFIESVRRPPSKSVKICDFGLAKQTEEPETYLDYLKSGARAYGIAYLEGDWRTAVEEEDAEPHSQESESNDAGNSASEAITFKYFGTAEYMAPEHWYGNAEKRSDIYSFGATFYHLLTGQPPFTGDLATLRRKHREQTPASPNSLHPGLLSEEISDLIMRCLEKNPDHRYQSFATIRSYLRVLPDLSKKIKWGYRHLKKRNYRRAISNFSEATSLWWASAEAWFGLGKACLMKGENEQAIGAFTRTIELEPDFSTSCAPASGLRLMVLAYYYRGMARKNMGDTATYFKKGVPHNRMRYADAAEADFKKAKELGYTGENEG